jgi:hypothetical protein
VVLVDKKSLLLIPHLLLLLLLATSTKFILTYMFGVMALKQLLQKVEQLSILWQIQL